MENTTGENTVYIKDLIFSVLHRWRSVVVAALVLGLLLGGYRGLKGMRDLPGDAQTADTQASYEQAMEAYRTSQKQKEKVVTQIQNKLEAHQEYLDNSMLMTMDAYDYYQAYLAVYVSTDYRVQPGMAYQDPDMTPHILAAYRTRLNASQTQSELAKAAGVKDKYFPELFSVKVENDSQQITVTAIHPEQAGAEELVKALKAIFTDSQEEIAGAVCSHEITFLEENAGPAVGGSLAETQDEAMARLEELQTQLKEAKSSLEGLSVPGAPVSTTRSEVVKKAVIFFVLGCIAGAFLMAAWVVFIRLVSRKIYSVKALINRTGVKVLGTVASEKSGNAIDRLVNRLEGRQTEPSQVRMGLLARDVANRCSDMKTLLVSGCGDPAGEDAFVAALRKAMPGAEVLHCGSILHSCEAVDALRKADAVLLVEQCGSSSYLGVVEQCQKADDYKKQLLGCILIGG